MVGEHLSQGGLPSYCCLRIVQKEEYFGSCSEWVQMFQLKGLHSRKNGVFLWAAWERKLTSARKKKKHITKMLLAAWQQRARWRLQEESSEALLHKQALFWGAGDCVPQTGSERNARLHSQWLQIAHKVRKGQKDSKVRLMWSLAVTKFPRKSSQNHLTAHQSSESVKLMNAFCSEKIHLYYSIFNSFLQRLGSLCQYYWFCR